MSQNIKQLELLISPIIGPYNQLVNYQVKPLYNDSDTESPMYSLVVKVQDVDTKKEKTINIIAKAYPRGQNGKALYNVSVAFTKEIGIYDNIVRTIQEFHEEYGTTNKFDMLPEFYGFRLSLDPNATKPDEDGLILLENLNSAGFKTVDRVIGYNLETAKVILSDLAVFHAVPLAYKLHKPQKFKQVFLKELVPSVNNDIKKFSSDEELKLRQHIVKSAVEGLPRCSLLASRITQALEAAQIHFKNPPPVNETFATLIHNNLWLNNILVKYSGSKPIKSKFVDFKVAAYDSLAKDLIFLLFSSVQRGVLDGHFDELVRFYHGVLVRTLESYECDVSEYDLSKLYNEIGRVIKTTEVLHLCFILKIVYAERGFSKRSNFDLERLAQDEGGHEYKRRLAETINFFSERDWI